MVAISLALSVSACASAPPSARELAGGGAEQPKTAMAAALADASASSPSAASDISGAIRQAQLQRFSGDLAGATHTLSQLVLVAPDDARVLGEYGKTLAAQGRPNDALAFLRRAIELQPNDWMLYSALGVANDEKGDYPAAKLAYGQALNLRPGEPTVLSNLALSHMLSGDLPGAETMLTQASQSGGDYPKIASNLALVKSLKPSQTTFGTVVAAIMPAQNMTQTGGVVMQKLPAPEPAKAVAAKSAMETARLAKGFVTAQTQSAPPGNERPGTPSSDALSLRGLLLELEALEASVARRKMRENATIEQQVPETAASFAATIEHLYAVADNIAATLAKDELAQTDMRVKRGAV